MGNKEIKETSFKLKIGVSKFPNLIVNNICLNYLQNALEKKTKKMTGHRANLQIRDG